MRKVVQAGNVVVLDEKNPHIRNNRDGTVIKLDVIEGVCTVYMWVCLGETGPGFQLPRTVSDSSVTNKPVRSGTKCSRRGERKSCRARVERCPEEGEDAMIDKELMEKEMQEQWTGE